MGLLSENLFKQALECIKNIEQEIKALKEENANLREALKWRTDWENMPGNEQLEIKYKDSRIYIGQNEMKYIEFYKSKGFGWRRIPELPESERTNP